MNPEDPPEAINALSAYCGRLRFPSHIIALIRNDSTAIAYKPALYGVPTLLAADGIVVIVDDNGLMGIIRCFSPLAMDLL